MNSLPVRIGVDTREGGVGTRVIPMGGGSGGVEANMIDIWESGVFLFDVIVGAGEGKGGYSVVNGRRLFWRVRIARRAMGLRSSGRLSIFKETKPLHQVMRTRRGEW
jgi:hypothetical protein